MQFTGSPQYQQQQQRQLQHQHPVTLNQPYQMQQHSQQLPHHSQPQQFTGNYSSNAAGAGPIPTIPCSTATITTNGTQFQNISKTATNLLNEIYEKHLLAQTRFEADGGASGQSGADAPPTTLSTMSPSKAQQQQHQPHLPHHPLLLMEGDFNFHNLSQQQQRQLLMRQQHWLKMSSSAAALPPLPPPQQPTGSSAAWPTAAQAAPPCPATGAASGGFEMMIKNNDRQRVPRKISETATLKIQRSLNEKQLALATAAAAASAAAAAAAASASPDRKPFTAPTSASAAVGCEVSMLHHPNPTDAMQPPAQHQHQYHWGKTNVNSVHGAASDAVAVEPSTQYGGHNAHHHLTPTAAAADVNGKISGRSEPLGGNVYLAHHDAHLDVGATTSSPAHTHSEAANTTTAAAAAAADLQLAAFGVGGHCNSKINIMLETAQAMAAAAYFARFVRKRIHTDTRM